MTSRTAYLEMANHLVTAEDLRYRKAWVVEQANKLGGPQIREDPGRGYGLFAERDYDKGEFVTVYATKVYREEQNGDYAAEAGKGRYLNAETGFTLSEKGRWINESDRNRFIINVELGTSVRTTRAVKKGEQFFADYGKDYQRAY